MMEDCDYVREKDHEPYNNEPPNVLPDSVANSLYDIMQDKGRSEQNFGPFSKPFTKFYIKKKKPLHKINFRKMVLSQNSIV